MPISGTVITLIILASFSLNYGLILIAGYLNLKQMKAKVPGELKGFIDNSRYLQSQDYLRQTTRLHLVESSVELAAVLIFWVAGGFPALDSLVRGMGVGPVLSGLAYIGTLMMLKAFINLPLTLYSLFIIEQKFGFNTLSFRMFISDALKTIALVCLLGGPVLSVILWFLEYAGDGSWLICWVLFSAFMVGIQYSIPTWIYPLFNTFTPLEPGELRDAIMAYAESIAFPLQNIFIMDGSKRSTKSNAFFTGFGKHRRIVLFDTLISRHTTNELVAILAHEMGHFKKKHIARRMGFGVIHTGIVFYLISACITTPALFEAFHMERQSVYAGLVFFAMLYSPAEMLLSVIFQAISRRDEREADRFAAATAPDRHAMITALKKLSADNLSNLSPHPMHVILHDSHPPILERIRNIASFRTC